MYQEIEKKLIQKPSSDSDNNNNNNTKDSKRERTDEENSLLNPFDDLIYQLTPEVQTPDQNNAPSIEGLQKNLEDIIKKFLERNSQLNQLKEQKLPNNYAHFSLLTQPEINSTDKLDDASYNTNIYERLYAVMKPQTGQFVADFKQLLEKISLKYAVFWDDIQKTFSQPSNPEYYDLIDGVYGLLQQFLSLIEEINMHYLEKKFSLNFDDFYFIPAKAIYNFDFSSHTIRYSIVGINLSSTDLSTTKVSDTSFSKESIVHLCASLVREENNNGFYGVIDFHSDELDNYDNNANNTPRNFNQVMQRELRKVLLEFKWAIDFSHDFHGFCYEVHDRITKIYKIMHNLMSTEGLASKYKRSSIELTFQDLPTEQHVYFNALQMHAINERENKITSTLPTFKQTLNAEYTQLGIYLEQFPHFKKSLELLTKIVNKYNWILRMDQDQLTAAEIEILRDIVQAEDISKIRVPEEISDLQTMAAFLKKQNDQLNQKVNGIAKDLSQLRAELRESPQPPTAPVSDAAKGMYL